MRAYTLSILSRLANTGNPIIEKEIVQWVNSKLQSAGKRTSLKNFQDSAIADGKIVIDLIDAIKPGSINYENVREGGNPEENLENAKYAVSMARKIGARVYALPEDITEVKAKMIMTVFACLMAMDYVPNMDSAAKPVAAVQSSTTSPVANANSNGLAAASPEPKQQEQKEVVQIVEAPVAPAVITNGNGTLEESHDSEWNDQETTTTTTGGETISVAAATTAPASSEAAVDEFAD